MPAKKATDKLAKREEKMLLALSVALARSGIARRLGKSYGGSRDIYEVLGYPKSLTFDDYLARYERDPVARTIIDAPSTESWSEWPEIYETDDDETTEFEKSLSEIVDRLQLQSVFSRLDKLAALGSYAILLLGFDDGGDLQSEATKAKSLLYATPYDEGDAPIADYEKDTKNPRFGLPVSYNITVSMGSGTTLTRGVHHTRVIHVAEDCLKSSFLGTPRLKPAFNQLMNLELVSCGSAEMFWRGALPGYGFKADEGAQMGDTELEDLKTEIEEYMHGLKRYIRLRNMSVEDLALQVADPSNHVSIMIDLIACGVRIPKRILLGSERGELASSQDERNWLVQIKKRRKLHCESVILRPFLDRLIALGVLPKPKDRYNVSWPDTLAPSEKEKADIGQVRSQALGNYVNAIGADSIIPPEIFLKKFLGFTDSDIALLETILEAGDLGE